MLASEDLEIATKKLSPHLCGLLGTRKVRNCPVTVATKLRCHFPDGGEVAEIGTQQQLLQRLPRACDLHPVTVSDPELISRNDLN